MNFSSLNGSSVVQSRDTFTAAVTKNVIVTALCISINYINGTLIHTFRKHEVFHSSSRYILFIHLVINDMIQLIMASLLYVISYALYTINVALCIILLIPSHFTTYNTPLNLAGMAVECYMAVCIPLRYKQICTVKNTFILIGLIWVLSSFSILPDLFILMATEQPQFFLSRQFCSRDTVFRSSYSLKKKDIYNIVCFTLVWLTLFYTYIRIVFTARGATQDIKKSRNTILLHGFQLLLCMLTYVKSSFVKGLLYLLPKQLVNLRFVSFIIVHMMPRFVSPIVYGLRDQTFRKHVKRYLLCKVSSRNHPEFVVSTTRRTMKLQ
ncbi:odorant receptor 131-2-like [Halichoeres trimaculatus]|uniref:odorant receptor 131-2-like n=1 Tax=Halichoeres trimaculatus TaxID=147232 RepID=UPI003D9E3A78